MSRCLLGRGPDEPTLVVREVLFTELLNVNDSGLVTFLLRNCADPKRSPLREVEDRVHPWVTFLSICGPVHSRMMRLPNFCKGLK